MFYLHEKQLLHKLKNIQTEIKETKEKMGTVQAPISPFSPFDTEELCRQVVRVMQGLDHPSTLSLSFCRFSEYQKAGEYLQHFGQYLVNLGEYTERLEELKERLKKLQQEETTLKNKIGIT